MAGRRTNYEGTNMADLRDDLEGMEIERNMLRTTLRERRGKVGDVTIVEFLDFLKARIDEDEEVARAADEAGEWFTRSNPRTSAVYGTEARVLVAEAISYRVAPHIARHEPARVLREVEAKRAIVWLHGRLWNDSPHIDNDALICREDREEFPCETLCHLASVYADHQDYREEWKR